LILYHSLEVEGVGDGMSEQIELFNDNEGRVLVMALAVGQRDLGLTEYEVDVVFNWARKARLDATLLELVLDGSVVLSIDDNEEIRFRRAREPKSQEALEVLRVAA
jgi:hypothetical protein